MLQQQVVSLLACLLTHLGIRSDLATNDLFEPAQNTLPYGWGAYDNPANETLVFGDAIALNRKRRRGLQRALRSEERRVGKECRCRWASYHLNEETNRR